VLQGVAFSTTWGDLHPFSTLGEAFGGPELLRRPQDLVGGERLSSLTQMRGADSGTLHALAADILFDFLRWLIKDAGREIDLILDDHLAAGRLRRTG
jgi:hypothetical protein